MRIRLRFVALVVCLLLSPLVASGQQQVEPPLVTVTGQAEVKVAPDEVVITMLVENTDKDLLTAKNQNDAQIKQVITLSRRYQIAAQDVQTNFISVTPKYSDPDEDEESSSGRIKKRRKAEFLGYQVSKTLVLRLTDITRFEALFSDILRAGISRITDVDFRSSQMRKYRDEARALAMTAAREKAAAMAKQIGQTIGNAYSIQEGGSNNNRYLSNITANNTATISGDYSTEDTTTAFAPGLISVSAQVTVSFRLN